MIVSHSASPQDTTSWALEIVTHFTLGPFTVSQFTFRLKSHLQSMIPAYRILTTWHRNVSRNTGPLWGGIRGNPPHKGPLMRSLALWCQSEQTPEQTVTGQVNEDALALIWCHSNVIQTHLMALQPTGQGCVRVSLHKTRWSKIMICLEYLFSICVEIWQELNKFALAILYMNSCCIS